MLEGCFLFHRRHKGNFCPSIPRVWGQMTAVPPRYRSFDTLCHWPIWQGEYLQEKGYCKGGVFDEKTVGNSVLLVVHPIRARFIGRFRRGLNTETCGRSFPAFGCNGRWMEYKQSYNIWDKIRWEIHVAKPSLLDRWEYSSYRFIYPLTTTTITEPI